MSHFHLHHFHTHTPHPGRSSHGDSCHLLCHIRKASLSAITLPSSVITLVSQPTLLQPVLQLTHVAPSLVVLKPRVNQGLLNRVALPHLHLKACKRLVISSMACVEISFQGFGGYIKEAFWICSLISSSSLKGKVPERET